MHASRGDDTVRRCILGALGHLYRRGRTTDTRDTWQVDTNTWHRHLPVHGVCSWQGAHGATSL